jgi:hypothetical protein
MFVLLQICPQAIGPDDLHDPIDVIAVDASRERLEQHLTAYRERHRVACAELEEQLSAYGDDWEVAQIACTTRLLTSIVSAAHSFRSPIRYSRSSRSARMVRPHPR